MRLSYDGQLFLEAECLVSFFGMARRYNSRGRAQTLVKRMVVNGEIIAIGQAAINTRAAAIINALSLDGGTVVLLKDDGSETVYKLDGPSSRGVRIVENSLLQQDGKAHFATGLPFQITFEGEYTVSDLDPFVSYSERITRIGTGLGRKVWVELDSSTPQEQITSSASPITVLQSGEAVGALLYPQFNDPIFPNAIGSPEDYQRTVGTPRLDGEVYVDYPISWNYRMTLPVGQSIPLPTIR